MHQFINFVQDTYKSLVEVGDKVYVINLNINNVPYKHFVVCSAKTKRVVWDSLFKGIIY